MTGERAAPGGAVLLRSPVPVTLVGGGPVPPGSLAEALALAPVAVAADGGGDVALPGGRAFRAVIGDMDSLQGAAALAASGVALHALDEQETTDLEKCLYSVEAPLYVGVGFLGGRIDHHLAAMTALARYPGRALVLVGAEDVAFLCPPVLELDLAAGTRVSLYPLEPVRGETSEGLRWPVAGLDLGPTARIGTSNAALGGRLRVGFGGGRVVAILPRPLLGPVAALLAR